LRLGLQLPDWNKASTVLLLTLTVTTGSTPLVLTYRTGDYSWAVAVSHDGRYVIAGSDDMHAYFFGTQSAEGKPLWSYATHGYVRHVAVSGDGSSAAAGSLDGSILFFKPVVSGNPVWSSKATSPIDALAMSEDGHYLAAGDRLGTIYFLKTSSTDLTRRMISGGVLTLSISKSGMLAATAARGGLCFSVCSEHDSRGREAATQYNSLRVCAPRHHL
jgi:WD40 repeat protein